MSDSGSDGEEDILLFPITDIDSAPEASQSEAEGQGSGSDADEEGPAQRPKPEMPLRERRIKRAYALAKPVNINMKPLEVSQSPGSLHRMHWINAIRKAKKALDPWACRHIDSLEAEKCTRYRYNALKKTWTSDEVLVKMESESFTNGAMRQCFRLKKHTTFFAQDWKHAPNYVAKCYMENVDRQVYFEDVKLQMDAKLWGEEYNRHNPPKKVDIFQMYVLEFKNREGSPLFHLEHFIEGDYIKYNSNSGFVEVKDTCRLTPQAFSHFTFERSGHKLIVVDIQGVGDLYTDPQIHTADGKEYGDGNLGPKGMALFFHSHICNRICESLDLTPFDMALSEMDALEDFICKQKKCAKTRVRGVEESCISASPKEMVDLTMLLSRHHSQNSHSSQDEDDLVVSATSDDEPMSVDTENPVIQPRKYYTSESESSVTETFSQLDCHRSSSVRDLLFEFDIENVTVVDASDPLSHTDQMCSDISSESPQAHSDEERRMFSEAMKMAHRPSCVNLELDFRRLSNLRIGESILGEIHHEMAKYHEIGRFSVGDGDDVDWEAALFHEEHAAELGVLEAITTLAKLHLGLQRDVLVSCTVQQTEENIDIGLDYMLLAAEAGDRSAMIYMARAFDVGNNLGTRRTRSWEDAIHWYNEAVNKMQHDEGGEFDSTMEDPSCILMARQAEMYLDGGYGLEKSPSDAAELFTKAAEAATEAMKGRLANKYFMLAEEAWAQVEDE